jgi:hypothetical protein
MYLEQLVGSTLMVRQYGNLAVTLNSNIVQLGQEIIQTSNPWCILFTCHGYNVLATTNKEERE